MGECRYTMTMSCYARIEPLIILFHAEICQDQDNTLTVIVECHGR